jgi:hypothetical protein
MLRIDQITDSPKQLMTVILDDGSTFQIQIEFKPMQLGWFITSIDYGDLSIKGIRIMTSPNMLQQFRNQIPFGLGCFVIGNEEPTLQEDFSSGRAKLYVLTEDDIAVFQAVLSGA